ncbi:hypothetical protein LH704_11770 [Burkholderia cenocepacia]|uniref:hypothetical protein n=1 Tax=Burkholderia cenocepacia TaxID=95486 RepID=UPI001F45DD2E|nr:hypothetical protein [Burkholderia cenocepacia]MCF1367334.1 hypothetical protein [Burkholderia cenocepacia]MCF1384867.1 hypothetical protein [Burkholderia cenocepacia]
MGIREEYERRLGEYLEYGRAVALLAKNERVSFSDAAKWLIEQRVQDAIPCYIRSKVQSPKLLDVAHTERPDVPARDAYVPHVPRLEHAVPASNGPLDILTAIARGDDLWWDWIGMAQRAVDENQRWKRDDFWRFVTERGVEIDASTFEDPADCPTFLLGTFELPQQLESATTSSRLYRGSASAWRYRAQTRQADVHSSTPAPASRQRSESLMRRLERAQFPLSMLESALSSSRDRYIAEVILASDDIEHRAKAAWEYKSIAELAEELFVQGTSATWAIEPSPGASLGDLDRRSWQKWALREVTGLANLRLYEEEEGLTLYVRDDVGEFRAATAGDSVYDFVCRLRAEGLSDDDGPGSNLPSWTRELYVRRINWESYCLVWSSWKGKEDPGYDDLLRQKKALVAQETARRAGRPYQSDAENNSSSGPLDPSSPLYPQELAIALAAWRAVTSNGQVAPDGVAAKTALMTWLGDAYPALGKDAKDRIATVANWNKRGGATRTPE